MNNLLCGQIIKSSNHNYFKQLNNSVVDVVLFNFIYIEFNSYIHLDCIEQMDHQ